MKIKELLGKKRSVLVSWIASYLVIVAVCILISGVVYAQAKNIIGQEMNRYNLGLTEQVKQSLDSRMQDIVTLGNQLSLDSTLQGMYYFKDPLTSNEYLMEYALMKDFQTLRNANSFISSFYIYLSGTNSVFASNSVYDRQMLYDTMHKADDLTYDEWLALMNQDHKGDFMPLYSLSANPGQKTVAYMKSLLLNSRDTRVTLVVLFDEAKLREAVSDVSETDKRSILILDSQNRIISDTSGRIFPLRYDSLRGESGLAYQQILGEKMAVTYQQSDVCGWKYVSVMPVSQFREKVEYIQTLTYVGILASLLICGIITTIFSRRNYNPIREILSYVRSLQNRGGSGVPEAPNEFDFIRDFIHSTQKDKEQYYKGWKKHGAAVRNHFLLRLLKGEIGGDVSVGELLETYAIRFDSRYFAVVLFNIDDYSRMFDKREYDALDMVKFAVSNVAEEIANQREKAYMVDCGDMMACLISLEGNGEADQQELQRVCRESKRFFEERLRIFVTISISSIVETIDNIPEAYQKAQEAMDYRVLLGGGVVIRYDSIQPARSRYPFGFDTQRKLINFIRAGDYTNALSTVNTVFDVQHLQDGVSVEMTQYTLYGLVNAMAQAMEGMADDGGMDAMEALKPLARTSPTRTVPDIKDEIQRVLQELCQCRNTDKKKCRNTDLQERVTQYVDRHYADSNMGVSGVAEYFHMNSLYLSRIFREQTGKSLPDYITECRIQKAKELIRQGHNVQNVSNEVGYANANSFIRIFKKVEGITPGKYSEEYSMPV